MRSLRPALPLPLLALAAACRGPAPAAPPPGHALASTPEGSVGRIEVRHVEARPRLTLVSRDGDPAPALVASVATDLGSVATTALASVVEARLRAAGFDADARIDRSAFRVRLLVRDAARVEPFLRALSAAFTQPVAAGSPEVALAMERVRALRASPLDAPELAPIAACTGRLGLAGAEPVVDLSTPAGVRELDGWRTAALHAGRTSIAVVGPAAFCAEAARAAERVDAWPAGSPATDAWPSADTLGVYSTNQLGRRGARVTVAARVASPQAAVAAAERLGAPGSPLRARLSALPSPFRTVEVVGVARPRGGCVSVTLEASDLPAAPPVETSSALAAAVARQEIRRGLAAPSATVATRQILTARDPRDAGARAAWWALSGSAPGAPPERWATALGVPPSADPPRPSAPEPPGGKRFEAELGRALAAGAQPALERRSLVERGQGEVWVLLASPCGVADEGQYDAGSTALAALSAVQLRRRELDVTIEPWITADAVGVIAHAPFRDDRETPSELARRVASAAARTVAATTVSPDALALARAAALEHLERLAGGRAAALEAFASALAPDHPSWIEPLGVWDRVASSAIDTVRLRWQALATGPLRLAVLANADASQATAAAEAAERWLAPRLTARGCGSPDGAVVARPGHHDVRLPEGTSLAQALVGARLPAAPAAHDLAELTVAALNGSDGLLAAALSAAASPAAAPAASPAAAPAASPAAALAASPPARPLAARASARLLGGTRAAALAVEIRAPSAEIGEASARVKALLAGLAQRATDADLSRAAGHVARHERDALAEPRRRLIDLWRGPASGAPPARITLAAWRAFLSSALGADAIVTVEARPD
ncbi:hypothetical protein SOCEGT47_033990 [Sorangium cellulosum]|uniref:Uncharacterized protein n=1 Tax=Sorangium cellulosum TaxID=56 RepID=A0A4P2Q234_SORCE|nr:hypothetical protein [Sorangium cellulosum]AUX22883.1 hypothetical protein SOCEGT47_033990 [Sorangium cellulosum]